ncbi:MAG: pyridoxal-dependent decarboxylase [Caulobacter sp.]|nr:pyridoxal-dependent decarboxylase [Caulobacter sp.]
MTDWIEDGARALATAHARAGDYRATVDTRPPRPTASALELEALFGGPTPEGGEDWAGVIEALDSAARPGLMAMTGRRFFGWVIGRSHPVGVAADWLTGVWGQNAANYSASPASAMAEKVASAWLLDILDLPRQASVGFVTGATMANFVGLAAGRNEVLRKVGWDVETDGLFGAPEVRVFVGDEAHATVHAALRYLGLGSRRAVRVATDADGRMRADALAEALAAFAGPKIVVAQAGQINSGAIDPMSEIAAAVTAAGAWLHVDGAFGLWARAAPETAHLAEGLDLADSWATDGHKWLQLPYDCGLAIVKDAAAHQRAMSITASYLPPSGSAEHDPSLYVPELSRRARGFAAWAVLRALGRSGIAAMVRDHCALAARLGAALAVEPGIEVLNTVSLNQLVVGFGAGEAPERRDDLARATIAALQEDNLCYAGGTAWKGRWAMRISVISAGLGEDDIDVLAGAIIAAWRRVRA